LRLYGQRKKRLTKLQYQTFFAQIFVKSFRPPFSKGGAVEGAEPSSRSAERETNTRRFFFDSFFLCACMVKEKSG